MSNDTTAPKREATLEGGAFTGWSTSDLAGQCRMQARENLDPELTAFMFAVADRLAALSVSTPTGEGEAIARALSEAEWPDVTIGNKALIQAAIQALRQPAAPLPPSESSGEEA